MMATAEQITTMATSPAEFRQRLLIDVNGEPIPLGIAADEFQRADFAAMDPALRAVAGVSDGGVA